MACSIYVSIMAYHICGFSMTGHPDMKEHDVSPDIVNEEPHFQDDPPDETTENSQPPRELESMEHEKHEESNLGAVSGFLSGFAAAVQNTVSHLSLCMYSMYYEGERQHL